MLKHKDTYDAVIIGAGMSGLVCGCYLAKAGMKVLIAEQHNKPGGYCTSFKRRSFAFDAAVHSFGGYRQGGIVRKVFNDLGMDQRLTIKRFDPSDIIITPDYRVAFRSDVAETIKNFQLAFPAERNNIEQFFYFLVKPSPKSFALMRNWTFKNLLNKYFTDDRLKSILFFPLFGNGGLPPSLMSVFMGAHIFTEFLLDGGYYPEGGMQTLPDKLAERFEEFGGDLLLSCPVKKIRVKDEKVAGVFAEKGGFIPSRYVISNCDARQTFLNLIGRHVVPKEFLNKMKCMAPSLSGFLLYLGIDRHFDELPDNRVTLWFLSHYDLDKVYLSATKGDFAGISRCMIHVSPKQRSLLVFVNAPFKNREYWNINKEKVMDSLIAGIERDVIPQLSRHIIFREAATPHTLYRYTLNYKGAAYGWACTPSQLALTNFRKPSFIRGLYLTGHWTTRGHGIPGVAYTGYDTAREILRNMNIGHA